MGWTSIIAKEPADEKEMSRLAAGFVVLMRKRATGLEGETTPLSNGNRPKRSLPDEEAQKD